MGKSRLVASLASLTFVAIAGTAAVAVQDHQMSAEEQKMMEAWTKAATPGPEQARMAKQAGVWDYVVKSWWSPVAPAMEAKGVTTSKMVLDGRYLEGRAVSDANGEHPFEGSMILAFDNVTRRWQSTWIDTMGTGTTYMVAPAGDGKSLTWSGFAPDPMTGKEKAIREVHTFTNDDQWKSETFEKGADGKDRKFMEIVFTRRKAG